MATRVMIIMSVLLFLSHPLLAVDEAQSTAEDIRVEATRPNNSREGRPLPLACSWGGGHFRDPTCAGWRPANQMKLIEKGHHLLPWFSHPPREGDVPSDPMDFLLTYYHEPIHNARRLRLPLTFIASQWESGLSAEPYLSLPPNENPNVIDVDGKILPQVSPFGPLKPWREIGRKHTDNAWIRKLQEWYPDPPLVVFLSNNEHRKLVWREVENSKRYLEKYGKGGDDDAKRKVVADGWIERYRALQEGMREGLDNPNWKNNAVFVGYGAFGPEFIGRWGGWGRYSLHSKGRINPYPLMWDGGSPSYYTHDWNPSRDDTMWSPQVEFMNLVFMQERAYALNRAFWLEISVWDGYGGPQREKSYPAPRTLYRMQGQTYTPERYRGFVQFGMWLLRPRAVREYRGWVFPWDDKDSWEGGASYFMALVHAVDRVYENPILKQWWRHGELVPNRAHDHPYQAGIPAEYKDEDRWFLLDADVNAQEFPWELHWPVNVFSLALVRGKAPVRKWLVYAHSPRCDRASVKLRVPGYKDIVVDVSVGGSFYLVDEKLNRVTLVE